MKIKLKDYNLAAARERMRAMISRERGMMFGPFGFDHGRTRTLRHLGDRYHVKDETPCRDALTNLACSILTALQDLSHTAGGVMRPLGPKGEWVPDAGQLRIELPYVRALMVLRGHPSFGRFEGMQFSRSGLDAFQPGAPVSPKDLVNRTLEDLYAAHAAPWSLERFLELAFEAACLACGDIQVEETALPGWIAPGSALGWCMKVIDEALLFDLIGVLDPAFTRQDALVGEWWLIQPVSPRLDHHQLATKFGLYLTGFLPPSALDAPGRVVMVCQQRDEQRARDRHLSLEDSKWVAGWQHVTWATDRAPLSDPSFDLVSVLEGITEDSYGPYKHSSELPRWP